VRAFAAGLAAFALIGATPHSWPSFHTDGVSVRYPPGWHATSRRLTPVTSPRQALVVTSYPLPRRTVADNCDPTSTLDALPANGALIFMWEYPPHATGLKSFPPRPAKFKLGALGKPECFGPRTAIVAFRQAGRFFEIAITLGRQATAATRATVLRILDSLAIGPGK
jgi:hypothetical protein